MSPNDFEGRFIIGQNPFANNKWWIGYRNNAGLECIYFYKNDWHGSMMANGDLIANHFDTKEAALKEFFDKYPSAEIRNYTTDDVVCNTSQELSADVPEIIWR